MTYRPTLPPLPPAPGHPSNHDVGALNAQGLQPVALFQPWIKYTNPAGGAYYFNPQARLITRLDPRVPGVAQRLVQHANHLSHLLDDWATALNARIFILSIQDDVVEYYMVEHGTRRIFWVHQATYDALQLPPAHDEECLESMLRIYYLESMLRIYYWAHVEECSEASPADARAEQDLIATLLLGLTPGSRHLTPFSNEVCRQLLDALQSLQATANGGYRMASVGRLWRRISEHQHEYKYRLRAHRARIRDPVAFVRIRQRMVFSWLDWLRRFVPQAVAELDISEICFFCYSALLVGASEHLGQEMPLESRPSYMGLVAYLIISNPLNPFLPLVEAYLEAQGLEVGFRARWHRPLPGLLAFDVGVYLGLWDLFCRAIGPSGSLPSTPSLFMVLFVLALPLSLLVLQFAGQR